MTEPPLAPVHDRGDRRVTQQAQTVSVDHRGQVQSERVSEAGRSRLIGAQARPGRAHLEAVGVHRQRRLEAHYLYAARAVPAAAGELR